LSLSPAVLSRSARSVLVHASSLLSRRRLSSSSPLNISSFLLVLLLLRFPHSFPTRRSSDLPKDFHGQRGLLNMVSQRRRLLEYLDRKSTRLNSSHEWISYAVFCLKKKMKSL